MNVISFTDFEESFAMIFKYKGCKNAPKHEIVW